MFIFLAALFIVKFAKNAIFSVPLYYDHFYLTQSNAIKYSFSNERNKHKHMYSEEKFCPFELIAIYHF